MFKSSLARNKHKSIKDAIVLINLVQALFLFVMATDIFILNDDLDMFYGLINLPIKQSVTMMLIVSCMLILTNSYLVYMSSKDSEDEIYKLIESLTKHRHEYLNHLETISYYLKNKNYDEAKVYLDRIGVIINTREQVEKINNISFAAVINDYIYKCENEEVYFEFNSNTDMSNFTMSSIHITTVFKNMLSNALYHCCNASSKDDGAMISFDMEEDEDSFNIIISNTGDPINRKKNIFASGVSTKEGEGRGNGLSIVKDIIERYAGGEIFIQDYDTPTFVINIKKKRMY